MQNANKNLYLIYLHQCFLDSTNTPLENLLGTGSPSLNCFISGRVHHATDFIKRQGSRGSYFVKVSQVPNISGLEASLLQTRRRCREW